MIVADLLRNGAGDGMVGHSIRDALDSAVIIKWFPRIATWSLGVDRSPRLSFTWEWQ